MTKAGWKNNTHSIVAILDDAQAAISNLRNATEFAFSLVETGNRDDRIQVSRNAVAQVLELLLTGIEKVDDAVSAIADARHHAERAVA